MHSFTKSVVIALSILSMFEVFSHSPTNADEDDHDAFTEFDEPGQHDENVHDNGAEEHLEIRSGSGPSVGKVVVPPIDMPAIRFTFCVSCGYRNAFEQYSQIIRDKYPGVQIEGSNYAPSFPKALIAQVVGIGKIALIVMIFTGRDPFQPFGLPIPGFYTWMLSNKMSACMLLFVFSNSVENMLMSTGAFEIYIGEEQIWSKLESGRVPSPAELVQGIDGYIAVHGGKTASDFGFEAA